MAFLATGGWIHAGALRQSEPEDVLADQLPSGAFVSIGVDSMLGFRAVVISPAGKIVRTLDASKLWDSENDFVPAIVCALDSERVLVFDRSMTKYRAGKIFSLKTGKVEKEVRFPPVSFHNLDLMKDGTLLGDTISDLLRMSQDGRILWRKSAASVFGVSKDGFRRVSVVKVTPSGEVAALQDSPALIRIFDSNLKPVRTFSLAKAGKWFCQRMAPTKRGFWVETNGVMDGPLVHVDQAGNSTKPLEVKLGEGSLSGPIVLGELSTGDPVIYWDGLYKVDSKGVASSLDRFDAPDDDLNAEPARR